jgi:hypothetical protein
MISMSINILLLRFSRKNSHFHIMKIFSVDCFQCRSTFHNIFSFSRFHSSVLLHKPVKMLLYARKLIAMHKNASLSLPLFLLSPLLMPETKKMFLFLLSLALSRCLFLCEFMLMATCSTKKMY